jgi:hypothetical protein
MTALLAIDPWDCGCTECLIGEYKPLACATDDDIADLLAGRLRDNTYEGSLLVAVNYRTDHGRNSRIQLVVDSVTVTLNPDFGYVTYEHTWSPDPYRAGLAK